MRVFDVGGGDGPQRVGRQVLTVPNLLSFARLAILPLVLLDLIEGRHLRAFVLLAVFTSTDWFDGYLARRFDQVTELGKLLDPLSDRVLFVVVAVGLVLGDLLPWWAAVALLARDVVVVGSGGIVLLRGGTRPEVTRLGKTATFGLMFALPAFLLASVLGAGPEDPQPAIEVIAWASFWPSLAVYWISGLGYARRLWLPREVLEAERRRTEESEEQVSDNAD